MANQVQYVVNCQLRKVFKEKKYGFSFIKDAEFKKAQMALKSKQKDLKKKGKVNKRCPFSRALWFTEAKSAFQ